MGQRPCTLCWHQRAFMFPLAVVLAVACFRSDPQAWRYALPLAGIGWLLSGYHSLLYTGVIPEPITPCDSTIPCSGAGMTLWRSEARRLGKECVSPCRSRWSPYILQKNTLTTFY